MYNANLENQLIIPDIANAMVDYVSIQLDIDESKVKAACIVAQNIDIKRIIGKDNLERCIGQDTETPSADQELKALIIPPLCYYTYSRLLLMFQGVFTDSGYALESTETEPRNAAKSVSKEMKGIAETLMIEVTDFLKLESPGTEPSSSKLTPRVRIFGGKENRASN